MDFANINLDFETLRSNYPHPVRSPLNPVKKFFDDWQAKVNAANELEKAKAAAENRKPILQKVPTSCCYQVSHSLNATPDKVPAFSYRRKNATIPSGNGFYLGAVDEMERYLVIRYGLTGDIASKGNWQERINFLKTLKSPGLITMRDSEYGMHTEFWDGDKILQNSINGGTMSESGVFSVMRVLFWRIGKESSDSKSIPDWLSGWWSVNDGEQYYYHFSSGPRCYYTTINPTGRAWPTLRDQKNEATVSISDSPPHVTLNWAHYGTIEWFTRAPGDDEMLIGVSNKYPPLIATKI